MLNLAGPDVPLVPMAAVMPVWRANPTDQTLSFVLEGEPTLPMPVEVPLDTGGQPGTHVGITGRIGGDVVLALMNVRGDFIFYLSFVRGGVSNARYHHNGKWQEPELTYPPVFELDDGNAGVVYIELRVTEHTLDVGINGTWYVQVPLNHRNKPEAMGILLVRAFENRPHTVAVSRIVARGLPMTRKNQPAQNLQFTDRARRQPPLDDNSTISVFVAVLSAASYYDQRQAVRNSWFLDPAVISGKVAVRFFVGHSHDANVAAHLAEEHRKYGDIIQIQAPETYLNVCFKTFAMVETMLTHTTAKYLLKCDDDTFLRLDRLLPLMESTAAPFYMGIITGPTTTDRDPRNRYFVSRAVYASELTPVYAHGPGYAISRDVAEHISQAVASGAIHMLPVEDVAMGYWVEHARSSGMPVNFVSSELFAIGGCRETWYNAHFIDPKRMLCMWDRLAANATDWCC